MLFIAHVGRRLFQIFVYVVYAGVPRHTHTPTPPQTYTDTHADRALMQISGNTNIFNVLWSEQTFLHWPGPNKFARAWAG